MLDLVNLEQKLDYALSKETKESLLKWMNRNKPFERSQEPIYRGCLNEQCFCTGRCKEVIGYETFKK